MYAACTPLRRFQERIRYFFLQLYLVSALVFRAHPNQTATIDDTTGISYGAGRRCYQLSSHSLSSLRVRRILLVQLRRFQEPLSPIFLPVLRINRLNGKRSHPAFQSDTTASLVIANDYHIL